MTSAPHSKDFRSLSLLFIVFEKAKSLSNLTSKPSKCNIVPLSPADANFKDCVRESAFISGWLSVHIPTWGEFHAPLAAKYLGFFLGPLAAEKVWKSPIDKWTARAREIARSHMGPLLAAVCYNARAIPVLGSVAQLLPPPPEIRAIASSLLHHVLAFTYQHV